MNFTTIIVSLPAVIAAVAFCDRYLDIPLAYAVQKLYRFSPFWAERTAQVPDLLFPAVCGIALVSTACYLYRVDRWIFNRFTWFCRLTACSVSVSYLLKICAKFLFGRTNTRIWLVHPEAYGFNWFHGSGSASGFPSGHMAVIATLAAAIWRFYPRCRYFAALCALFMAGALIATNYHFLGDVIAGAYLGVLVEAGTFRVLSRNHHVHE